MTGEIWRHEDGIGFMEIEIKKVKNSIVGYKVINASNKESIGHRGSFSKKLLKKDFFKLNSYQQDKRKLRV